MSFLALQDLMLGIGYSPKTAWVFPVIIDTTLAVCTLMLVALGDKPVRRFRAVAAAAPPASTQAKASAPAASALQRPHSARPVKVAPIGEPAPVEPAPLAAPAPHQHADGGADCATLAQAVVDAGATTKPVEDLLRQQLVAV